MEIMTLLDSILGERATKSRVLLVTCLARVPCYVLRRVILD